MPLNAGDFPANSPAFGEVIPFATIRRNTITSVQSPATGTWTLVRMNQATTDNGVAATGTAISGTATNPLSHATATGVIGDCKSLFAPKDGLYLVQFRAVFDQQATPAGRRSAMIVQVASGSNLVIAEHQLAMAQGGTVTAGISGTPYSMHLSAVAQATTGDEFCASVYQGSGGALDLVQYTGLGVNVDLAPTLSLTWLGQTA